MTLTKPHRSVFITLAVGALALFATPGTASVKRSLVLAVTGIAALVFGAGLFPVAATAAAEQLPIPVSTEVSPQVEAESLAVPTGCSLRTIDGGRTSEAKCSSPGHRTHYVRCTYGSNGDSYYQAFTTFNEITCDPSFRVTAHHISDGAPSVATVKSTTATSANCALTIIDGGRTSWARCGYGTYEHSVYCTWGSNLRIINRIFEGSNEITCPTSYRVGEHYVTKV